MTDNQPQKNQDHDADESGRPSVAIEGDTKHAYGCYECNVLAYLAAIGLTLVYSPKHNGDKQDDINDEARVEWHAKRIDEEQFKPTANGNNARNDAIENGCHDDYGHKQGNEGTFEVCIREFAVVEHQHNGRDTKKVEQVNADAQAGHVGDKHQITVAMWFVCMVFPFQNQPENNGRESR